jgi:O-antigen ligase
VPAPGAIAFWALMAVVALAPLPFGANRPWAWSLLSAAVGIVALAWAVSAWRAPALATIAWRRHAFLTVPFLAVLAWAFVQSATFTPESWHHPLWPSAGQALGRALAGAISLDPGATEEAAMRLAAYGAVFFLIMQLGRDPDRARQALWVVVLAGAAYAIYGLTIELGGENTILGYSKWAYGDSLTSTFVNRNAYAVQVGLALIAALALLSDAIRGSGRYGLTRRAGIAHALESLPAAAYVLLAIAVTLATALVMTRSRGGLATSAMAVAALALTLGLRRETARAGIALGVGTLVGAIAILAISGGLLWSRIAEGIGQSTGRDLIHALARETIADRPWLGHGLGTFGELFRIYRDDRFGWASPAYREAHSTYLELAAELGLPAATLLILVVTTIAALCLAGAVRRRRARIYPCVGVAAAMLVGLQALFDFAIQIPAVAVTFATLAGVGFAQSYRTTER